MKGSNGSFWHGECLGWQYPVLLLVLASSPNLHRVDCASFQPLRSPSKLVFDLKSHHSVPNKLEAQDFTSV